MKLLVKTKGEFTLHDLLGRQTIPSWRPAVVTNTPFIQAHKISNLEIIEELDEEADDATLALAEDLDAAIAALPRRAAKPHPLDHDGDGRKGGSRPRRAAAPE